MLLLHLTINVLVVPVGKAGNFIFQYSVKRAEFTNSLLLVRSVCLSCEEFFFHFANAWKSNFVYYSDEQNSDLSPVSFLNHQVYAVWWSEESTVFFWWCRYFKLRMRWVFSKSKKHMVKRPSLACLWPAYTYTTLPIFPNSGIFGLQYGLPFQQCVHFSDCKMVHQHHKIG